MSDAADPENGEKNLADPQQVRSVHEVLPNLDELPESVLARIVRGDGRRRAFGTPRNPRMPTIQEFNPRIEGIRAGDLALTITGRRHGIFTEQAERVGRMSHEELMGIRPEDPVSAFRSTGGLSLTGGHHRIAEIINRVQTGQLSPDTIIRILVHD
jgi:hypothetical protein